MDRGWGDDKGLQGVNIIILFEGTCDRYRSMSNCNLCEVNDQYRYIIMKTYFTDCLLCMYASVIVQGVCAK